MSISVALVVLVGACTAGTTRSARGGTRTLRVVAAEDVWGSIARQLGGQHVAVRSLVSNPNTDPHEYEPTAADARWLASADLVVANGIGYDPWIDRLLAANGTGGRRVVHVGTLVGLEPGDNPHQWYSPGSVSRVITAISDAYKNLDPTHSSDYDEQRAAFETVALAPYRSVIHAITAAYAGTPIGASESVFVPMAQALGLNVRTPGSLLDAVSEGGEPTAADKTVVDRQIATRAIKVFVFNTQNATPDVQRLVAAARAAGVPVTAVTETLTPRGAAFQDWQTAQLQRLESALHAGTGA